MDPFSRATTGALLIIAAAASASRSQIPTDRCPAIGVATRADCDGVRRAALDYLEGFYEGDTAKLVRGLRPEVSKYGFFRARDSTRYAGETMSWAEILGYARDFKAKHRVTPPTAPRAVELLEVQNQSAVAKVTAWWGTDYLLVGKYDGRWMISHVLWQSPPRAP